MVNYIDINFFKSIMYLEKEGILINIYILSIIIFLVAITMSMVGKGGGNFYVIALVLSGMGIHQAAPTSQSIMLVTSIAAFLIFQKNKKVDWKLAVIIDTPTNIMAFVGGYFAGAIEANYLKVMFAILLIVVSIFMMIKVKEKNSKKESKFWLWKRDFDGKSYTVNLLLVIPITAFVGFFAGATGISGGAIKVPLMVMMCGIPMEIAVATSSAMVALTALSGLLGYSSNTGFNLIQALPLMGVAVVGGVLGGKFALKSKPENLKIIFALTNMIAGVIMIINVLTT